MPRLKNFYASIDNNRSLKESCGNVLFIHINSEMHGESVPLLSVICERCESGDKITITRSDGSLVAVVDG